MVARVAGIAGALAGLAVACASFPRAPDEEGGKRWIRVSTPNFSLATDMEIEPATAIAHKLENWWEAMDVVVEEISGGEELPEADNEPVLIIALGTSGERKAVHYNLGGVFSSSPLMPPAASIGNIDEPGGEETLRHELAHAFLRAHLPRTPIWFDEGMATYLQTAEPDPARGTVEWGTRYKAMYERSLVGVEPVLNSRSWAGEFAISRGDVAWAAGWLVRMLINQHPDEVRCYLKGLKDDLDIDATLARCFRSRKAWQLELDEYHGRFSMASKKASFQPPSFEVRSTEMTAASVHAVLALLDSILARTIQPEFRAVPERRSLENTNRALALNPAELLAAFLALDEHGVPRRAELLDRLIEEHPGEWRVWIRRAQERGVSPAQRKQASEQALKLAPRQMAVLYAAAFVALGERRWADAERLGRLAWLRGASDASLRAVLRIATLQLGMCKEATFWAKVDGEDRKAFAKSIKSMRSELELPEPDCVPRDRSEPADRPSL